MDIHVGLPDISDGLPLTFRGSPVWTKRERQLAWKQFDVFARSREPVYEEAALELLDRDRTRVAGVLSILQDAPEKGLRARLTRRFHFLDVKGPITEESLQAFFAALDNSQLDSAIEWARHFKALNNTTGKVVAGRLAGELGINVSSIMDPFLIPAMEARANLLAGKVAETTFDRIREAGLAGATNGWSTQRLSDEVLRVFGQGLPPVLSPAKRALLIARTETTAVTNAASLASVRGSELELWKDWLSQGDERVRAKHDAEEVASQDSGGIPLEESFPVTGLEHPGEPNCRCTLLYVDPPPGKRRKKPKPKPKPKPTPDVTDPTQFPGGMRLGGVTRADAMALRKKMQGIDKRLGTRLRKLDADVDRLQDQMRQMVGTHPSQFTGQPVMNSASSLSGPAREAFDEVSRELRGIGLKKAVAKKKAKDRIKALLYVDDPAQLTLRPPEFGAAGGKITGGPGKKFKAAQDWIGRVFTDGIQHGQRTEALRNTTVMKNLRSVQSHRLRNGERAFHRAGDGIYVTAQEGTPVIVHEWGHALEAAYPDIYRAAVRWRSSRTTGEKIRSMNALTGKSGYRIDERGWKDKFIDPYVGKQYGHISTEVVSMGLEYMVKDPLRFSSRDFEHFHLILNIMRWDGVTP